MLHSCVHRCRRWGRGAAGQDLKVFGQTQNLSRAQKSHNFLNFIRNNKLIVLYLILHLVLGTNSSAGSGTSIPRLKHLHSDGVDLVDVVDIIAEIS